MRKIRLENIKPLDDRDRKILFVFGAARSGTTYLGKTMEGCFDYGMGPEGGFVGKFAPNVHKYGDLSDRCNMEKLLTDIHQCNMLTIMRERWRDEIRTDVTMEMLWDNLYEASYAGAVYSVFSSVAKGQGRSLVGNKDPGYLRHLDLLHKMFPVQARYLDIIRDGRDVAMSNLRMEWGQSNIITCARSWKHSLAASEAFAAKLQPGCYLQIQYEKLLDHPLETVTQIGSLLDVPLSSEKKQDFLKAHESNKRKGNHGKWRQKMSLDDQRIFEAVAGDTLRKHGYETVFDSPSVSLFETATSEFSEFWRKAKLNLK